MSKEDDIVIPENPYKNKKAKRLLAAINSGPPHAILAGFYRDILDDIKCGPQMWMMFMNEFVHDIKNGISQNTRDISSARGNIHKELQKPGMTWKVFCKGLQFIKVVRFEIILRAYHSNGTITEHSKTADFSSEGDDE
jgi:hypothetical protein